MLNEIGIKGEWVLTGKDAIQTIAEHNNNGNDFFAVILDWKMPEMDGIEITRKIRKIVGKSMPIIIISAYDWSDIELEARAAGANAFISKPLFKSRVVFSSKYPLPFYSYFIKHITGVYAGNFIIINNKYRQVNKFIIINSFIFVL